ncbi:PIG-L family deacetylase [Burkholderia cenocepacia]|nr:PIG-L family deacetylase [Burkholderia cenocepacia]
MTTPPLSTDAFRHAGLVVSAHSADFVWRAAGSIAVHAALGYRMKIVCLSFGERGESAKLWRKGPQMIEATVKAARREEAQRAADILGAEIEFFDLGDYPLRVNDDVLFRLVDVYRELQPSFVLSHSEQDPYNFDHPLAMHVTQEARIIAQAEGHRPGEKIIGAPAVFAFEPHQTEQCAWVPNTFIDITSVWDRKRAAIECMAGQEHLWDYYTRVALQRGVQAKRNIGITAARDIKYAEGLMRLTPVVTEVLA